MPPAVFAPAISGGERQQTYTLNRAATGNGSWGCQITENWTPQCNYSSDRVWSVCETGFTSVFCSHKICLGWLYENSANTVQSFCNSHNGMEWKNLCRVSVDEVASMLVWRSLFQVLVKTVAAVFRWDIPVTYYSMINGSVILALTQLNYTNNLRERSYTFRLTWSHLQAVT
jgi:hypothetical protein